MSSRLAVLGSTGSVGRSVLEVVRHHPERLAVAAVAARGSDLEGLAEQVREFDVPLVAIHDAHRAAEAVRMLEGVEVVCGDEGLERVVTDDSVDRVVGAMVGAAGLPPVYQAIEAGKDVALANKEVLVVAGRLIMDLARRRGVEILPIDSEHAALHQVLRGGEREEARRLVLTASGGPFRDRPRESFANITTAEALDHPTWKMGAKITIDSATLMNKGLELIEASFLFGFPGSEIDVVVHPQSIIHSMVEYRDGSWLAQLSVNDMIFPVQYALSFPERWGNEFPRLDMSELGRLDFEPLDDGKFPAVSLARQSLEMGESAPAVLNAANEVAVQAFLDGKIPYLRIVDTVERVLELHDPAPTTSLGEALEWDRWGRERAGALLN